LEEKGRGLGCALSADQTSLNLGSRRRRETFSARLQRSISSVGAYNGFDSALYRKLDAEWRFSQENATLHDFKMATVESKPL
jgi:hypothetical protein